MVGVVYVYNTEHVVSSPVPGHRETSLQCWVNAGPASRRWPNINPTMVQRSISGSLMFWQVDFIPADANVWIINNRRHNLLGLSVGSTG